ncbi:MAG: zinc-dependent alcohol dehydrogenase family protein [Bradyrhizobium sp.]
MTAAILYEQFQPRPYVVSQPLVIDEVDIDGPGPGEVLIEVRAAGICHTDLSTVDGVRPRKLPVIPGHEVAGIVRDIGEGVTSLQAGDHVVGVVVTTCGKCQYCFGGRPNLCEATKSARANGTLQSGARRIHLRCEDLNHFSGISAFAQYAVCAESSLVRIEKNVSLEVAALFGCAVMTGVGAVMNTAKVPAGVSAAVVGLGGVGLSALLGLVASGAYPIVAVDSQQSKCDLARTLGATHAVLATSNCVEEVRDITGGGVEYAFEMAGSIPAMTTALAITRRGGTTTSAGLPATDKLISFRHAEFVTDERTIKASYMGSCVPRRDVPKYLELYRVGRLPIDRLQSGTIRFHQLNEAMDLLADGGTVRQVLLPHAKG